MGVARVRRALAAAALTAVVALAAAACTSSGNAGDDSSTAAAPVSSSGYTLFTPIGSTTTYLIDEDGQLVHAWDSEYRPGQSVYLLEDGDLLRTGTVDSKVFNGGGRGGIVQRIDWNGSVVWEYTYATANGHQHHDIAILPNGNVLIIAWEYASAREAVAAGRDPAFLPDAKDKGLWFDHIIEVDAGTKEIVWGWHVTDHLVQDHDPALPGYGHVSEHPELIDINYNPGQASADFTHINSIDYNPESDQILLSVHSFSEIWVIDHATTTAEAAGEAGDLVYRWGNPATHGGKGTQTLFAQHDAEWIDAGLPGAGNVLIFNNGHRRLRPSSSVEEIILPADGVTAEPTLVWSYDAQFFADHISGSQRLEDGNTLLTNGPSGTFIEVSTDGVIVWTYVNPIFSTRRGGEQANEVFRAERYPADYPGLDGRDLTPIGTL